MSDLIRGMQLVELEMLKAYANICRKHKLTYFLLGGTCLGAIRHQGFIPWDDDIDVGMPRKDYAQFLAVAQSELPKHIFLQTHETDPEYPMGYAKLRNSNTTFIEKKFRKYQFNHGIWMDVFPLDGYAPIKKRLRYKTVSSRIGQEYIRKTAVDGSPEKEALKSLRKRTIRFLCKDFHDALRKRDAIYSAKDYDTSPQVVNYYGAWGTREIVPRSCLGKGKCVAFEGEEYMVPEDFDTYLSTIYGDYMTLPPEEKRVSHHESDAISLHIPYKEFLMRDASHVE